MGVREESCTNKAKKAEKWVDIWESRKRAIDNDHDGWNQGPGDGPRPFKSLLCTQLPQSVTTDCVESEVAMNACHAADSELIAGGYSVADLQPICNRFASFPESISERAGPLLMQCKSAEVCFCNYNYLTDGRAARHLFFTLLLSIIGTAKCLKITDLSYGKPPTLVLGLALVRPNVDVHFWCECQLWPYAW